MMSVEAELLAVERDFAAGRCGAFEDAGAQQEVAKQLQHLRALESDLFAQSRAIWDWNLEEQALWEQSMHRPQQQQQPQAGQMPSTTTAGTPSASVGGGGGVGASSQPHANMNGADQLAMLFGKRDQALRNVSTTVRSMTKAIATCGDVVSRAPGTAASTQRSGLGGGAGVGGGGGGGAPSGTSAAGMAAGLPVPVRERESSATANNSKHHEQQQHRSASANNRDAVAAVAAASSGPGRHDARRKPGNVVG